MIVKGYNLKMKITFGLTLLSLVVANPTYKINNAHKYMTDAEFKSVFPTERHNVPKYHVTPIYSYYPKLYKRSASSLTRLSLNVFGRDIDLLLNPTDGILAGFDTPVYHASRLSGLNVFQKLDDAMTAVGKILEDREKRATLIVKKNHDDIYTISGTIESEDVNVKPLPDRLNNYYYRLKRSAEKPKYLKNATLGEYSKPFYHVIYKKTETPENTVDIGLKIAKNISQIKAPRSKRSVPAIIYPQILVIVDYGNFRIHRGDVNSILEYMLPFWNSVDLRFRLLEAPKIRLNIAGIVIAIDPDVLSFFTAGLVSTNIINGDRSLNSLSEYMYQAKSAFPFDSYDIAVAMTSFDMCSSNGWKCSRSDVGKTYNGGACGVHHAPFNKILSVAILQDRGAFEAIPTAAHEIGHLIGGHHDVADKSDCSANKGYIMAANRQYTLNSAHWSYCSLEQFAKFFREKNPTCLYDKPGTIAPMPRVLPGRWLTMDEHCKRLEGTKSCTVEGNGCTKLGCVSSANKKICIYPRTSAADGTICDTGKICLYGQCLSEAEISERYT